MLVDRFLESKIKRQVQWNGRMLDFIRFRRDAYGQITDDVDEEFSFRGVFHEGGGYGGMLNIELYESDGARTTTRMKPMILCLYADGDKVRIDDYVRISNRMFSVVDKSDVSGFGVAFEISLELDNREGADGRRADI